MRDSFVSGFAAVTLILTSAVVGLIAQPEPAVGAPVTINMGEATAVQHDVKTNAHTDPSSAYTNSCVRYNPSAGASVYSTSVVTSSQNLFASFGYGVNSGNCPSSYNSSIQSTVGLKPARTDQIDAGEPFLVATMVHGNRPISHVGELSPTIVDGVMDLTLGSEISSSFPWTLTETTNTCKSTFDATGNYDPTGAGRYAFNSQGQIGLRSSGSWGGWFGNTWNWATDYHYAYDRDGTLRSFPRGDGAASGANNGALYGSDGRSCEDDELEVSAASSSTPWTDPATGIQYKLKLWGFVNNGTNATCSTNFAQVGASLEHTFITKEGANTYGCLYGSMEQVRPLTFAKDVTTDPALEDKVTIPQFTYTNISPEDSASLAWGSISPLKPTTWGEDGRVSDPNEYELLAPDDKVIIQEKLNPKATDTTSGWRLKDVTCVTNPGGADEEVLMKKDGTVLTESSALNREAATLQLDETQLASQLSHTKIKCTWHNEYVGRSQLTLRKQVIWSPLDQVSSDNWTLTATPTTTGEGYKTISGLSGQASVTGQTTASGEYSLSESLTGSIQGFAQDGEWVCTGKDGAVAVTDGKVVLEPDDNVTCTVTNKFQTGTLTINKEIIDPDGGLADANKTYTGTYDCGTSNGKPFTGTWSATQQTPAVISNLPLGASCAITEDTPTGGLKDDSYRWGTPTVTTSPVTVPQGPASGQVTVTNTIARDTGSLTIKKVVKSAEGTTDGGWIGGTGRAFEVTYTCDVPGTTEDVTGTTNVSTGTPAVIEKLPAGSVCTFEESALSTQVGDFADTSYEWDGAGVFGPTSVTIVKDDTVETTVTNTYKRVLVDLNIAKTVEGDGLKADAGAFAIDYDCGTGYQDSVSVSNGQTATVQVPRNALCSVVEPDSSKDESYLEDAYDWGTQSYTGLDSDNGTKVNAGTGGKTVTVTNPTVAAWGKVSVTKTVTPSADPVKAGVDFHITVSCDKPAQGQTDNYTQTFALTATGSSATATTPYIAAGAECTVSEPNPPIGIDGLVDASYIWGATPEPQTVTVLGADTVSATVTNTWERYYGGLVITKQLTDVNGQGADNTYTGTWTCKHPGDPDVSGTWSRTGQGNATLTGANDTILRGSTCTAVENDPGAPNPSDESYIFSSWGDTSGETTIDPDTGSGHIDVTNVVTRNTGGLTVTKTVDGASAGSGFEDTVFTFDYTCTPKSGDAISGVITVKAGETSNAVDGIPEGASCVVTERTDDLPTPIDPYRWDTDGTSFTATPSTGPQESATGNSITATMPGGANAGLAIAAKNTMSVRYGAITVTKTVAEPNKANGFTGGSDEIFPMTLTCDGSAYEGFSLADGGSRTITGIELGRECVVTEGTISSGLADGSYTWGAPSISDAVTITVEGDTASGTIAVTNTIDRVRADIGLVKTLDGNLAQLFGADNTYSGGITCTHDGDADVTGTWTITGAGTATVTWDGGTTPYVDSTCTPTEDLNASGAPDADPSYSWGTPEITSAVVTADGSSKMSVSNTINRDMGSLVGAKVVAGETNGLKDDQNFILNATCTTPGVSGELTATATVTAGDTAVAFDEQIPAGWTCTFSEATPSQDQLKDASYAWESSVVVPQSQTVGKDETVTVTATNTITRVTSNVALTKDYGPALAGNTGAVITDAFSGTITCNYSDHLGTTGRWNLTWTVNGQGAATITGAPAGGLPIGTVCSADETAPTQDQLKDISYKWTAPVVSDPVTISQDAAANTLTVTNDVERVEQSITIVKEYSELEGALADGAVVQGAWTCTQADNTEIGGRWELPAAGGSTTISANDAGTAILAGSTCTVTEDTPIDANGLKDLSYQWKTPSYEVSTDGQTFTEGSQLTEIAQDAAAPTVKITNSTERIYGSIAIDKVVTGLDGIAAVDSNVYSGEWTCTAQDGTVNQGTWTVTKGGTATLSGTGGGDPTKILVGSTCTVTETARPLNPVSNDLSYEWIDPDNDGDYGTVAQAAMIAQDAASTATITNEAAPRNIATGFTVKKALSGATDGAIAPTFSVDYQCTAGVDSYSGTIDIAADGTPTPINSIPVGATCTLTETAPDAGGLAPSADGSFSWTDPMTYSVDGATADDTTPGAVTFSLPAVDADVTVTVTNDVIAHAGVKKTFESVDKHLVDGDWVGETWDLVYTIRVTNPSNQAATVYSLTDTPQAPDGTTINMITVTGEGIVDPITAAAGPVTIATDKDLDAGAAHVYTVVVNVTSPDVGVPGIAEGDECTATSAGDGKAVVNNTAVTSHGVESTAFDCGNVPINPKFAIHKDAVEVTRTGDTYTATYTVTVENTSNAKSQIISDITDAPALPATALITGVSVSENGADAEGAVIPGIVNGVLQGDILVAPANAGAYLDGTDGQPGGTDERVFTIAITFTVDSASPSFTEDEYVCAAATDTDPATGLVNTAAMTGDSDGEENNTACLELTPSLRVEKNLDISGDGPGVSTFDVDYTITVTNDGALAQSTGVLTDAPDFADGLIINNAWISADQALLGTDTALATPVGGVYTVTDGVIVGPGEAQIFYVRFNVTIDPAAPGYTEDALDCSQVDGITFDPKHGLFNAVNIAVDKDSDGYANNTACDPVSPDSGKRPITIVKTGSQGPLDGAEFAIYTADPAGGASPLANGVVAGSGTGVFVTANLEINKDYWLVETQAPTGHSLLPQPVKFHLTATTIVVDNAGFADGAITVSQEGGIDTTITVTDLEKGTLPKSGGAGIIPNILAASLLLIGAVGIATRRTTRLLLRA